MHRHLWIVFLSCSLVFTLAAARVCAESKRKIQRDKIKLEDVKKKIEKQKDVIKSVELKEASVIEKLDRIEKELALENREYIRINSNIKSILENMRKSRRKISELQTETQQLDTRLKKRLGALYKYHRRSGLRILLSSPTYNDFLKREHFLAAIITNDRALLRDCLESIEKNKAYQTELKDRKEELLKTKQALLDKRSKIKEARKEKVVYLDKIKREKDLQVQALAELEKYSKELQVFVDRLPNEKSKFKPRRKKFSTLKGNLVFPVKGKIISRFGRKEHPELHTYTFQKGIDIAAPGGTAIKAVYDGKVIFADWFKGYGYMIIIDHGESYYSLSAHASKLLKSVDDIVEEGETIALVGDTNSIKGHCLYFEIRHHGKPQNPLKWLKKGGNKS